MASPDEELRIAEQTRALDVHRASGAMIVNEPVTRRQKVVAVTHDDLDDILSFDGVSAVFGTIGMFLLSGSVWIIAEKALGIEGLHLDSLMTFCFTCAVFGVLFMFASLYFWFKKRGRISRIFDQAK